MKVKYYISLVQTGDSTFTVEGITKNAAVNQIVRKNRQVNKIGYSDCFVIGPRM